MKQTTTPETSDHSTTEHKQSRNKSLNHISERVPESDLKSRKLLIDLTRDGPVPPKSRVESDHHRTPTKRNTPVHSHRKLSTNSSNPTPPLTTPPNQLNLLKESSPTPSQPVWKLPKSTRASLSATRIPNSSNPSHSTTPSKEQTSHDSSMISNSTRNALPLSLTSSSPRLTGHLSDHSTSPERSSPTWSHHCRSRKPQNVKNENLDEKELRFRMLALGALSKNIEETLKNEIKLQALPSGLNHLRSFLLCDSFVLVRDINMRKIWSTFGNSDLM